MYRAKIISIKDSTEIHRNSIGGYAVLPIGYKWPCCPETGKEMVLFLQFDIKKNLGLPFNDLYHITFFMSPNINEIPSFKFIKDGENLPELFWEKREKHFKVILHNTKNGEKIHHLDPYLKYKRIEFENYIETDNESIKIGGEPLWVQDPENHRGPLGEKYYFLCQIPEFYGFEKNEDAPEQPDSFSKTEYCLFLGNEIYFFVSNEIDNPEAVWIAVQGT